MFNRLVVLAALAATCLPAVFGTPLTRRQGQQPFKFPLPNGFPNLSPGDPAINQIQQQAHGTLPNQGIAPQISNASAAAWSFIAFNELFEVAFFTSLLNNITNNVPGFVPAASERQQLIDAITVIQAQEEIHALGALAILGGSGRAPPQPCQYIFPSSNLDEALAFATTFTDVTIGTLEAALSTFGGAGDLEFLPLTGSVIGEEGEQVGYFRSRAKKVPTALPLLTTLGSPVFAYSALQQMVVLPGSCPSGQTIPVPILPALTIKTKNIDNTTTTIQYSFTNATLPDPSSISLAYINQFNKPISVALQNITKAKNGITFSASFPYAANLLNGLTIATVVEGQGPFSKAQDVASAALFGPALIEVD